MAAQNPLLVERQVRDLLEVESAGGGGAEQPLAARQELRAFPSIAE